MSDPDFDPKDELQESFKKRRISSEQSNDSVFTSPSSPRGSSTDAEVKPVETQPSTAPNWTVVDVSSSPPKQEASKVVIERSKPAVATKPKPAPPPKTKPKSPQLSAPKSPVITTVANAKPSKPVPPKPVNDIEKRKLSGTDEKASKVELTNLEIKNIEESETAASTSPNGGVKSMLSVFQGNGKEIPAYAKPDMSQKKPKSFFTNEKKAPSLNDEPKKEEAPLEEGPAIPERNYTVEDVSPLSQAFKSPPPPPALRSDSPQASPKLGHFNSSRRGTTLDESIRDIVENPYEVVERRTEKPLVPVHQEKPLRPPLPHHNRIESRKNMPPAPPSPYRDRRPTPPSRDVSLPKVDSDYAEVGDVLRNGSLYSEVDSEVGDRSSTPEVEAYFTRDVVFNLPTKSDEDVKRVAPRKPLPYQVKDTGAGETNVKQAPPKPAPYRPKSMQDNFPNKSVTSEEDRLQSPGTPDSPRLPVVIPGSPRLASAKLVNSAPSSTSSSPKLDRPPAFKPPPPPRVSSMGDVPNLEVTKAAPTANGIHHLNSGTTVNGILDRFDKSEIPTRDTDVASSSSSSKPALPRKPQIGSKPNHTPEDIGPPSFKPPPPPTPSSLVPRAYGVISGSVTSDRGRAGSQNGTDAFNIIAPPPLEWMDGRSERSASKTSVDSLDLKIVPPPPMHFKELENNNDSGTVNLDFDLQTIIPPSGWEEGTDKNSKNTSSTSRKPKTGLKKGSRKNNDFADLDVAIVPPPPPSVPPPTLLPLSSQADYDLDLIPSPLSDGPGELNIEDVLGDFDRNLSVQSDDEDFLPPAPLPPGDRYIGVPPPPGDGLIKPLVPPLRKQR